MIQTCQVSCIMHRTYSISPCHSACNSCTLQDAAVAFLPRCPRRTHGPVPSSGTARGATRTSAGRGTSPGRVARGSAVWHRQLSFIHWIRKNGEVKGLAKAWVCQESLICKMKTEAVKSVDLNKL